MVWNKKGLIWVPDGSSVWARHSVLTPTPFILDDKVIRIYGGFRDEQGVTRIGFIDVLGDDPSQVLKVSDKPVLDIGAPGTFDDNGIILGDVVRNGDEIRMYYVGFQIPTKVKFFAFAGLASSTDGGQTFQRVKQVPVMDRVHNSRFIRAIHTVIKDDDKWRIWYAIGNGWQVINDISYPRYHICYTESEDGINFSSEDKMCLGCNENEYRIGRPRVTKTKDGFEMRFTSDTYDKLYSTGYATSKDGVNWTRHPEIEELPRSQDGWDSQMTCYPVLVEWKDKKYLFYSGNNMGQTGVGYAEWA